MIAADQLVIEFVGLLAGAGVLSVAIQAVPSEGREWTAFLALIAVLFWFMRRVSKAMDANTAAQNNVANALSVLTEVERASAHATELKRAELAQGQNAIANKLDVLAERVEQLKAS